MPPKHLRRSSTARAANLFAISFAVAPLAITLAACGETITVIADSGSSPPDAGPADTGVVMDANTPDAGDVHPDAEVTDTGSEPVDSGVADAGGMPELTWGLMTVPANTSAVTCIHGRATAGMATEIFAGTATGKVLYYRPNTGWTEWGWSSPNNFGIRGVYTTASRVFVADETTFYVFNLGTTPSRSLPAGRSIRQIWGVSDSEIYIVSDTQNGRALYVYDGTDVRTVSEPTDVAVLTAVYQAPDLKTYVGGNGKLYLYGFNTLTEETVDWPAGMTANDIAQFEFHAIGNIGSQLFAAGSRNLVFRKEQNGHWVPQYTPFSADGEIHRIIGFNNVIDPEGYAVGNATSQSSVLRYYKNTWAPSSFAMDVDVLDMWAASLNEYYAVGNVDNMLGGVILRGSR